MASVSPDATPEIGVVVITHRARQHLERCLPPLLASPLRPRVLVVNSGSGDGTLERAAELGAQTLLVDRREFNHGATRELARRHLGCLVTVFLTPDAYPADAGFLERLTAPLLQGRAEVAYGRQRARAGADLVEAVGREFNYPCVSHVRRASDRAAFGSYLHFCSNACAAWWGPALDQIGGFKPTLVSEETVAAAQLLARGARIAYVADAVVEHSHRQRLADAFRRQFDIGYARSLWASLLIGEERDEVRGRRFAAEVISRARRRSPRLTVRASAHLAAMWLGYRTGRLGSRLPDCLASRLSGQDYFWSSSARPSTAATVPA